MQLWGHELKWEWRAEGEVEGPCRRRVPPFLTRGLKFHSGFRKQHFSTRAGFFSKVHQKSLKSCVGLNPVFAISNVIVNITESYFSAFLSTLPPITLSLCWNYLSYWRLVISNGYISALILQFRTQYKKNYTILELKIKLRLLSHLPFLRCRFKKKKTVFLRLTVFSKLTRVL